MKANEGSAGRRKASICSTYVGRPLSVERSARRRVQARRVAARTDAAHALVRSQMQKSPNLAGMTRLLEAQQAVAEEPRRSELELMRTLIRQRTKNLPRYTCQNCGFRARQFYWQCPGCSGWETYPPRRVEPITASN